MTEHRLGVGRANFLYRQFVALRVAPQLNAMAPKFGFLAHILFHFSIIIIFQEPKKVAGGVRGEAVHLQDSQTCNMPTYRLSFFVQFFGTCLAQSTGQTYLFENLIT